MGRICWSGETMTPDGYPVGGSRARPNLLGLALFLLVAPLAASLATAAPARADLRLCNKTTGNIGVAVGYKANDSWVTEGWWNVEANNCEVVVKGPLNSRYYYVYAVDYDNGGEWGGQAFMCTQEKEFTISGIEDCVTRGFERTGFFEVDTGEQRNWTIQLTERPTAGIGGQ